MTSARIGFVGAFQLCGLLLASCSVNPTQSERYYSAYRHVDVVEVSVAGDVPEYLESSLFQIYNLVRRDNTDEGRNEKLELSISANGRHYPKKFCSGVIPGVYPGHNCSDINVAYVYNVDAKRAWGDKLTEYTQSFRYEPKSILTRGFATRPTDEALKRIQASAKQKAVQKMLGAACRDAMNMFDVYPPKAALSSEVEYVSMACLEWSPTLKNTASKYVFEQDLAPSINWRAAELVQEEGLPYTPPPHVKTWFYDTAPERRKIAIRLYWGSEDESIEDVFSRITSFLNDSDEVIRLEAANRALALAELLLQSGPTESKDHRQRLVNETRQGMASHPDATIRTKVLKYLDLESLNRISKDDPDPNVRESAKKRWEKLKRECDRGAKYVAEKC